MGSRRSSGPNMSLVRYLGSRDEGETRPCGYCKGSKPGNSDYLMMTANLSPVEYQILMDRGWRRSGSYCYLPVANITCCPAYTIRCDSSALRLSRRQKRVIKCLNEFLTKGIKPSDKKVSKSSKTGPVNETMCIDDRRIKDCESSVTKYSVNLTASTSGQDITIKVSNDANVNQVKENTDASVNQESKVTVNDVCKVEGEKYSKKAKYLRMKKSIEKLMRKTNYSFESAKKVLEDARNKRRKLKGHLEKSLEERMNTQDTLRHRITIKFVSTSVDTKYFQENVLPIEHEIFVKYQIKIHQDAPEDCQVKQFKRFLVDSTLRYESFNLNCTTIPNESSEITGYGSYHMQYWLDDSTLLAVSVIDITSIAFSSVYFFYDPDYTFLNPGTLSALFELKQVRQLSRRFPHLKYYYMGYYIDTCQKMRYKKQFKPSYLLCPEVKTWHPIEYALPKLQISKYSRLNQDTNVRDDDETIPINYTEIQVTLNKKIVYTLQEILSFIPDEQQQKQLEEEVDEYISLVGRNFAKSVVFFMPVGN